MRSSTAAGLRRFLLATLGVMSMAIAGAGLPAIASAAPPGCPSSTIGDGRQGTPSDGSGSVHACDNDVVNGGLLSDLPVVRSLPGIGGLPGVGGGGLL